MKHLFNFSFLFHFWRCHHFTNFLLVKYSFCKPVLRGIHLSLLQHEETSEDPSSQESSQKDTSGSDEKESLPKKTLRNHPPHKIHLQTILEKTEPTNSIHPSRWKSREKLKKKRQMKICHTDYRRTFHAPWRARGCTICPGGQNWPVIL